MISLDCAFVIKKEVVLESLAGFKLWKISRCLISQTWQQWIWPFLKICMCNACCMSKAIFNDICTCDIRTPQVMADVAVQISFMAVVAKATAVMVDLRWDSSTSCVNQVITSAAPWNMRYTFYDAGPHQWIHNQFLMTWVK